MSVVSPQDNVGSLRLPRILDAVPHPAVHNVKAYGAVGDGIVDDGQKITDAINAAGVGGTIYFPPGTYNTNRQLFLLEGQSLVGQSADSVTLRASNAMTYILGAVDESPDCEVSGINFELTYNGVEPTAAMWINQGKCRNWRIHDCRFTKFDRANEFLPYGIYLDRSIGVTIERCDFIGRPGQPGGAAIRTDNGARELTVRRCRGEWLTRGVYLNTPGYATPPLYSDNERDKNEQIRVIDCEFDGCWTILGNIVTGTATYDNLFVDDPTANFDILNLQDGGKHYVRVIIATPSTGASFTANADLEFVDPSADFVADGVLRGDIVRTETAYATVTGMEIPDPDTPTSTVLRIDKWRDNITHEQAPRPASSAYTVVHPTYGELQAHTATRLQVARWLDLWGNQTVPPNGSTYELTHIRSEYMIATLQGVQDMTISGNYIYRAWADGISFYGTDGRIVDNDCDLCQDTAITVHGDRNIVSRNRARQCGNSGVYLYGCHYTICADNVYRGPGITRYTDPIPGGAGITVFRCTECDIRGNVASGAGGPNDQNAIAIYGGDHNRFFDNRCNALNYLFVDTSSSGDFPEYMEFRNNFGAPSNWDEFAPTAADSVTYIHDGLGREEAAAEAPDPANWQPGYIVDFTDTGDDTGTGFYLKRYDGTWMNLNATPAT